MNRFGVLVVVCLGAASAHADTGTTGESGMLPNGATLSFQRTFIHEDNSAEAQVPSTPDALLRYFNLAHCVCAQPNGAGDNPDFHEKDFEQEVKLENNPAPFNHPLQFWAGVDCLTELDRASRCSQVAPDIPSITNIQSSGGLTRQAINVFSFINAKPGQIPCDPETAPTDSTLWGMVDTDGNSSLDFAITKQITTDIKAPQLPSNFKAIGADESIEVSWTPAGDTTDVFAYQALCATTGGAPAGEKEDPLFKTGFNLCGGPALALTPTELPPDPTMPDAGVVAEPEGIAQQLPDFVCATTQSTAATGLRIEHLKNGTPYVIALLVMDRAGNARGVFFTSAITPVPAVDLWEDIHDRGSNAEGGFCLIADTYGDGGPITRALRAFRDETLASTAFGRALTRAYYGSVAELGAIVHGHLALRILAGVLLLPFVAFALLWHVLTLPGLLALALFIIVARRRRWLSRRRWLVRIAPAALVLGVAMPRAHAQTPYWDATPVEEEPASGVETAPLVRWHAGVRLGPYIPGIDKQLGMNPGPYKQMFGDPQSILPMVDVERIVWRRFGQLGFGGSIGFLGKTAHSYTIDGMTGDPNRPRAEGDKNSFRLIPLSANVVYRFSYLDDEYGIPLVPYIRGGLAYYVWWISKTNGSFASVCKDGIESPCIANKARGASLGVVGSIGLSIRAERIDAAAARSMRDSGIQHAGFYGEFSVGKVDGFGSDKKLSVGDNTWFAGVDFEF